MTSANGKAMVEIDRLIKRFGPETAVDNFNISISEGEFVTLLGPSGCGKTTTLRCIIGLERPDQGEIRVGGTPVVSAEKDIYLFRKTATLAWCFKATQFGLI